MRQRAALPRLVLNVPALAGRTAAEVARILGRGTARPGAGEKVKYHGDTVEVVYVGGKARWIKLQNAWRLPFSEQALPKLGLPARKPTYVNPTHVMSWSNLPHIKELTLYAGKGGKVSSVLICVQTSNGATSS